ncbi:YafY family protein [Paenibacillus sp.]|uniref:helix-turn-helix transcriptional regulator n=1 Tax=Paenibacillus sp. TaxID=58172 RepID=UPI002D67A52A|nr:YafY family protein [Paenibacillus sp.]HZG56220.1 YafY family protein [Paenibacillus sp.]
MQKAQRLVQLMMLVNERRRFTVRELAEAMGVSRRTMLRDLGELEQLGVPLYSEVGAAGGYRVLHDKMLPPIYFTENEALAIFFAAQSLQRYASLPFELETASALRKFTSKLPRDVRDRLERLKRRLTFWVPPRRAEAPHLRALLQAALDDRAIEIEYDGASGRAVRRIRPGGVYAMNGLWYVQAYCERSEQHRVFRADRVMSARIVEAPADGPPSSAASSKPDVDLPFEPWPLAGEADPGAPWLEAEFTPAGARRAASDPWLSEALVARPDGAATVRLPLPASYVPWAAAFFLGYGADVRVDGPEALRGEMRRVLTELHRRYS